MKQRLALLVILTCWMGLMGCGMAHTVRPIGKNNMAIIGTMGGPWMDVGGATVPLPLTTIGLKYGISERNDLFGQWHVLPAVVHTAAFEFGGSWYFLKNKGGIPGLSTAATAMFAFHEADAWVGIDANLIASWKLHANHMIYGGFHLLFAPVPNQVVKRPPVHFAPVLGGRLSLGKKRNFRLLLEVKWGDPWTNTDYRFLDYLGKQGVFCLSGGFEIKLGQIKLPNIGGGGGSGGKDKDKDKGSGGGSGGRGGTGGGGRTGSGDDKKGGGNDPGGSSKLIDPAATDGGVR